MNNKDLINQLECNFQSQKLHVFTHKDRPIISVTLLTELKKCIKNRITSNFDKKIFENTKFFKFRCFDSNSGQLNMGQIAMTKIGRNNWNEYDRSIIRICQ